jgi:hypothetical protein
MSLAARFPHVVFYRSIVQEGYLTDGFDHTKVQGKENKHLTTMYSYCNTV